MAGLNVPAVDQDGGRFVDAGQPSKMGFEWLPGQAKVEPATVWWVTGGWRGADKSSGGIWPGPWRVG